MIEKFRAILLKKRGARQTVFKNFLWLLTSNVGTRILRGAVTLYAARVLGDAGYGVFAYAFGLAGLFVFVKDIGVDVVLTREVAKNPEARPAYLATSFWIELGLLAITLPLLLFVAPLFSKSPEATTLIPLVALSFILDDLRDLFVGFFRGTERMEFEAFVVVGGNLLLTILGFAALLLRPTPHTLVLAYVGSSVAGLLLACAFLRGSFWDLFTRFRKELIKPIFVAVWPLALSSLAGVLFLFDVDTVMLGWWKSTADIGLYGAAQRFVGVVSALSVLVGTSAFPALSRFVHQGDRAKARELIERILAVLYLISLPIIVGGVLLRGPLMGFVFGASYAQGGLAFAVLLLTMLGGNALGFYSGIIFAHNQQKRTVIFTIIAGFLNVGFNFLLIPVYGAAGCAAATVIADTVYTGALWWLSKRSISFTVLPHLVKIAIASALMGVLVAILAALGVHVLISVVAGAAVYFLLLHLLKEPVLKEVLGLAGFLRKSESTPA